MEERGDANMDSLSSAQTLLLPTNGERCDEKKCCLLPFASYLLALAEPAMNQRGGAAEPKLMKEICTSSAMIKLYIYIHNIFILSLGTDPAQEPNHLVRPH
jgi:hypothetical protein